ncbi:MAG: hypothetical protein ACK5QH_17890 [Rubrivivax sp.]
MSAAALYQDLIVNPTFNMKRIQRAGGPRALGLSTKDLGLRPETKLKDPEKRQFDQQFELDAAMWYGAIMTGPNSYTTLRLFHLFYYAGVIYRAGKGEGEWDDWSNNGFGNLASLLSHGGRVTVQIPTLAQGGGALWAWLNQDNEIQPRGYATHGLDTQAEVGIFRGHKMRIIEKGASGKLGFFKGAYQSVKGHVQGRHYSYNVALGGEGNMNPFSASTDLTAATFKPIKGDGLNGHVYINYMPPTQTEYGGLLVGCENAEHGKGSNPHTKAGHGLGGAQKVSAAGGFKWTKLKCGPMKEYGGLVCDLTDRGADLDWILGRDLLDPDRLSGKTSTVLPVNGVKAGGAFLANALASRRRAMGYDD